VFVIDNDQSRLHALKNIAVDDIWGVGRQYAKKLIAEGINTAYELSLVSQEWARKNLGGVIGMRMVQELNGISCIELEMVQEPKKSIAAARSFGKIVTDPNEISEALSFHIFRASEKLRAQNSVAKGLVFFFHSSPFSKVQPYFRVWQSVELPIATNDPRKLNEPVQRLFKKLFRPGIRYQKAGVILQELSPADNLQGDLFSVPDSSEAKKLLAAVDGLNTRFGRGALKFANSGFKRSWMTQANYASPRYTTSWNELMKVR